MARVFALSLMAVCLLGMAGPLPDVPAQDGQTVSPVPAAAPAVQKPVFIMDAKIQGPTEIRVGQLVKFKAALQVTQGSLTTVFLEAPTDTFPTAIVWQMGSPPAGYKIEEWVDSDGLTVSFASEEAGVFQLIMSVSKWTGGPKPLLKTVAVPVRVVASGGQTPVPPITPTVPQVPQTPPADPAAGATDFAKAVRDKAGELVPVSARSKAAALAAAYQAGALKLAQDSAWTPQNAAALQRALNDEALGADRPSWKAWSDWIGAQNGARAAAGRMATNQDIALAWSEIALGLSLVR